MKDSTGPSPSELRFEHDIEKALVVTTSLKGDDSIQEPRTATTDGDVVSPATETDASKELGEDIVDWDGPDDKANPMNWSPASKWTIIAIISTVTFNVSMASTILAPGVPSVMKEFNSDNSAEASLLISVYIIGLVVGPLFLTPLGELYGRCPATHAANVVFLVATVICGVSVNLGMLITFRLVMGMACSVPTTLGGGFIADLMVQEKRGHAYTMFVIGPLLGPILGPIAGGFLSLRAGWRWTFWLIAIIAGFTTVLSFVCLRETYGPRLLELKTRRLRKTTGNERLKSKYDKGQPPSELFKLAITRPTKFIIQSPIVSLLSLFASVIYSYFYLLFTTFTSIFEDVYGFNSGQAGLVYLGMGVGFCIAQISVGFLSDRYVVYQKNRRGGVAKPEDRLPPLITGAFLVPFGLLWFGWTAEYQVHWIAPVIGTGFCGIGIYYVLIPIQMYLVDAYTIYAASAIAANTVFRSIFGTTIPLAGPALYEALGVGWGNTLLGCLAIIFAPASILLWKYGERIRLNPKYQPNL